MKKEKRRLSTIFIAISIIVLIGIVVWVYQSNNIPKSMSEDEFNNLKDKEIEIIDTSIFYDEKIEKWYEENRKKKGEYIYHDGEHTFILLSVGEVEDEKTFLLLNGVKDVNGKLVVGYDTIVMDNAPTIEFKDNIRSTLFKVKGKINEIEVIDVLENN